VAPGALLQGLRAGDCSPRRSLPLITASWHFRCGLEMLQKVPAGQARRLMAADNGNMTTLQESPGCQARCRL
jgi:hypothetical protein